MTSLKPDSIRILGTILRELEQTLTPELSSTHSQTVAHLLGQGLRNLISRENEVPGLLEDWIEVEARLAEAAKLHSGDESKADSIARHNDLGKKIESYIQNSTFTRDQAITDPIIKDAVLAEQQFYAKHQQAIDTFVAPQRSDENQQLQEFTAEKLTPYLREKLPQFKELTIGDITPILSGFSKEATLVDMTADGNPFPIVIRRNITYGAVDTSVADEYPLVKALSERGLPVPEPILLETDKTQFGEVFSITRRAKGAAACNSMAGLVAGPELKNAALQLAEFLAKQHQIDLASVNLGEGFIDKTLSTETYLEREIDLCEQYQRNHGLQPSATLTAGLKWLRANIPAIEDKPRLVHGDAALANIMMDGDNISVMLDWELAHPGDYVEDLAYSRKWVDQIMPWDEFINHYYQHGGLPYRPEREKFYAVLSDLRVAMFTVRTIDMFQKSDQPMVTHMFGAQHYYGHFVRQVAEKLLTE